MVAICHSPQLHGHPYFNGPRQVGNCLIQIGEVTQNDLKKFFPYASKSTFARNADPHSSPPCPKPKRPIRDDPLAAAPRKESHLGRVVVRIISFRTRLLDADNLVGGSKYFTDGLRYAGLIPGDAETQIRLEVRQEKVQTKQDEHTRIEIEPCPD